LKESWRVGEKNKKKFDFSLKKGSRYFLGALHADCGASQKLAIHIIGKVSLFLFLLIGIKKVLGK
jgi:hypothetical protein